MARVTYVKSAKGRKDGRPRHCTRCRTEIKPGDPYRWFANRIGRMSQRKDFCANCQIRPSDQTTSPHLQTIYLAQEGAQDTLDHLDAPTLADIAEAVRGYAEGVREAGESYGESADNIEEGFGHETYQSEEIREKGSACESLADELDSAADDIEGLEDPEADEDDFVGDYEGETDDDGKPVDVDEFETFVEDKRQERRDAAIDAAQDAINEEPSF
jgi:hypothetical protein